MKIKSIYFLSALLFCLNMNAGIGPTIGIDITPSRYVFNNLEEGLFTFDGRFMDAYYAPNTWPNADCPYNNGFVTIGYEFGNKDAGKKTIDYYCNSTSIVDLGGEVGKALCFKGFDCPDNVFPLGIKADNKDGSGDWVKIQIYSPLNPDKSLIGTNKTFTVRIVSKILTAMPNDEATMVGWMWRNNNGENWGQQGLYSAEFENLDDWNMIEITSIPSSAKDGHFPITMALDINPQQLINSVFLIKEINFIADTKVPGVTIQKPSITSEIVSYVMDPVGLDNLLKPDTGANYTVSDGQLTLHDLKAGDDVVVSTLAGAIVHKFKAQNSAEVLPLGKGYFTVKVAGKAFKVLI